MRGHNYAGSYGRYGDVTSSLLQLICCSQTSPRSIPLQAEQVWPASVYESKITSGQLKQIKVMCVIKK